MRRLSDYRGDEALEVMGDLLEPATDIMADPEIKKFTEENTPKVKIIKYILKHHKEPVIKIMAVLEGVDIEDDEALEAYRKSVNILTLPKNLLAILNDPDVQNLFTLQVQTVGVTSSTPASEGLQAEI